MNSETKKQSRISSFLKNIYRNYIRVYWTIFGKVAPVSATKSKYKKVVGTTCSLSNPRTLTEKMQWLKLYEYRNNKTVKMCIDKYKVREYLKQKGCEDILNDLYGVWDNVDDIDWNSLPSKFVLKCNHGCGYNIICDDISSFDIKKAKKTLRKWMKEEYGGPNIELVYKDIKPKIICERFIDTENGKPLVDYKFFCNYGTPKLIYMITGGHGDEECLDYYTTDWEWIPVNNGTLPNARVKNKKPAMLDEMLKYASILSKDFPIVRVDLYSEFGKIIFGELTFLATGGMSIYNPVEYDEKFGAMFEVEFNK